MNGCEVKALAAPDNIGVFEREPMGQVKDFRCLTGATAAGRPGGWRLVALALLLTLAFSPAAQAQGQPEPDAILRLEGCTALVAFRGPTRWLVIDESTGDGWYSTPARGDAGQTARILPQYGEHTAALFWYAGADAGLRALVCPGDPWPLRVHLPR